MKRKINNILLFIFCLYQQSGRTETTQGENTKGELNSFNIGMLNEIELL